MIDVEKQRELFEQFRRLGDCYARLGSIVQNNINDFPVNPEDFADWNLRTMNVISAMEQHRVEVFQFIQSSLPAPENPIDKF